MQALQRTPPPTGSHTNPRRKSPFDPFIQSNTHSRPNAVGDLDRLALYIGVDGDPLQRVTGLSGTVLFCIGTVMANGQPEC